MTTTLNDMPSQKKPEPSAEEIAAKELVRMAQEQGLSLTGPDGLLKQFTKNVLETALNEEMTEHLGHEKNRAPEGQDSSNIRNGTRPKTVLTRHHRPGRARGPPRPGRQLRADDRARSDNAGSVRSTRSCSPCMPTG